MTPRVMPEVHEARFASYIELIVYFERRKTMTNAEHDLLTKAVNEFAELDHDVEDIDEALEYLNYDEILSAFVAYWVTTYGTIHYKAIKYFIEEFYHLTPKTNDDLNIY